MKQILAEMKRDTRHFCRNWWAYLTLFVSVDLVIQLVAIPLFRLVTTYVLQAGAIPFVSYQNIVTIVTQHPFVVVALLVELAILLLVVYWQFAIILLGVRDIQAGTIGVRQLLKESGQALRQLRASSLVILLGYFVLVVPFADLVFRTPLLSKIQIPAFILDYLTRNVFLLTGLFVFYGLMIVLGVRFLLALPLMVYCR
ncbi:MAG: glycerophosphoryl diester phosphodiesterase membrane domain-containing protein, partial [Limosilactobacillus sp.]